MAFNDDERALLAQQEKDLNELYPTAEAWEARNPVLARPQEPALQQQYDDFQQMHAAESRVQTALKQGETSTDIAARRQGALDAHDRAMMRGSAAASRDTLRENEPRNEPGAYTVQEARDRAGHVPCLHRIEPEK